MQHKSEHNAEASAASSATAAGNIDCVGLSNSQGVGKRIMGLSGDRSQRLLNEKHDDDDDGGGDNNTVGAKERRKGEDGEVGNAKERTSAAPFASAMSNENEQFEAGRKEKQQQQQQQQQQQVVKTKPSLIVDTSAASKDASTTTAGMPRFTFGVQKHGPKDAGSASTPNVAPTPVHSNLGRGGKSRGRTTGRRGGASWKKSHAARGGAASTPVGVGVADTETPVQIEAGTPAGGGVKAKAQRQNNTVESETPRDITKLVETYKEIIRLGEQFDDMIQEESMQNNNEPVAAVLCRVLQAAKKGNDGRRVIRRLDNLLEATYQVGSPTEFPSDVQPFREYFVDADNNGDGDKNDGHDQRRPRQTTGQSPMTRLRRNLFSTASFQSKFREIYNATMGAVNDVRGGMSPYDLRETLRTITIDLPSPAQKGFAAFAEIGPEIQGIPAEICGANDGTSGGAYLRDDGSTSTFQGTVLSHGINNAVEDAHANGSNDRNYDSRASSTAKEASGTFAGRMMSGGKRQPQDVDDDRSLGESTLGSPTTGDGGPLASPNGTFLEGADGDGAVADLGRKRPEPSPIGPVNEEGDPKASALDRTPHDESIDTKLRQIRSVNEGDDADISMLDHSPRDESGHAESTTSSVGGASASAAGAANGRKSLIHASGHILNKSFSPGKDVPMSELTNLSKQLVNIGCAKECDYKRLKTGDLTFRIFQKTFDMLNRANFPESARYQEVLDANGLSVDDFSSINRAEVFWGDHNTDEFYKNIMVWWEAMFFGTAEEGTTRFDGDSTLLTRCYPREKSSNKGQFDEEWKKEKKEKKLKAKTEKKKRGLAKKKRYQTNEDKKKEIKEEKDAQEKKKASANKAREARRKDRSE